jgi:hypothetical protein
MVAAKLMVAYQDHDIPASETCDPRDARKQFVRTRSLVGLSDAEVYRSCRKDSEAVIALELIGKRFNRERIG